MRRECDACGKDGQRVYRLNGNCCSVPAYARGRLRCGSCRGGGAIVTPRWNHWQQKAGEDIEECRTCGGYGDVSCTKCQGTGFLD